jgi:hypothetical protein
VTELVVVADEHVQDRHLLALRRLGVVVAGDNGKVEPLGEAAVENLLQIGGRRSRLGR